MRTVGGGPAHPTARLLLAAAAVSICLRPATARAFQLDGHEVIEAAAYRRLLALDVVPGTGDPGVSGRALLASLIATGVLREPPCFDRAHPHGDCGAAQRLDLPLLYWPLLGSGAPDIILDRQLGQNGQCQHFMARTDDGLSPPDPRFGAPVALATTAYSRCVRAAGSAFDGVLHDPYLAHWRMVGTYALIHGIEDSFSAAHVDRDPQFKIIHLLSWTLIDWPRLLVHGRFSFPAATHHAISEPRDNDYVRWEHHTKDGSICSSFHNPYAFPEECLTDRARAAVDAVVDLLVVIYRVRARALAEGRRPTMVSPPSVETAELWMGFLQAHVASVAVPAEIPTEARTPLPRPDVFLGVQAIAGSHEWGVGLWGTRLSFGPALPLALGLAGGAGYTRDSGGNFLGASAGLGVLLPLVRRFSIGATPAGVRVICDAHFNSCTVDPVATLGLLLVPLGDAFWLGVEGPGWSWSDRALTNKLIGVSLGWSHERGPHPHPPDAAATQTWDPPRPDEVHAYRHTRSTRAVYLAATAASTADNQFIGAGLDWRLDRDRWDRRAGIAPGFQLEIDHGTIEGTRSGGNVAITPTLSGYLVPNRIALTAAPALLRFGALAGHSFGVDLAGRAGVTLEMGRLRIAVDSPPLSYLSQARWHAVPFTVRLGLMLN